MSQKHEVLGQPSSRITTPDFFFCTYHGAVSSELAPYSISSNNTLHYAWCPECGQSIGLVHIGALSELQSDFVTNTLGYKITDVLHVIHREKNVIHAHKKASPHFVKHSEFEAEIKGNHVIRRNGTPFDFVRHTCMTYIHYIQYIEERRGET